MTDRYQLTGFGLIKSLRAPLFHSFAIHDIQLKLTAKSAFRQYSRLVQIEISIRFQAAFSLHEQAKGLQRQHSPVSETSGTSISTKSKEV